MEITELFLEKYKELESVISLVYGGEFDGAAVSWLERKKEFRDINSELKCCRETRNLLQHNVKISGEYAVVPNRSMIDFIDGLIVRIENPTTCGDIAVPFEKVFYKEPSDNVKETMCQMRKLKYTHVPILVSGKVAGVFSEHTAFKFFLEKYEDKIDKNTTFKDIFELISLKNGTEEVFKFAAINTRLSEIEDMFEDGIKKNEKIRMIFLTKTGDSDDKLLGIVSHWDIIGKQ